jgi:hypothetical protein
MKKNIIICGLIAGLVSISGFFLMVGSDMNFDNGMIYGFASMLVAFSLIFVGVKNYRDKYNNGTVTFGKAFMIGLYISLIASTIYVVSWLIDYHYFIPDFADRYAAHMLSKMKANGASQADMNEAMKKMAEFKELYKNPIIIILYTYAEILPLGIIVSLISAAIMKRKPSNPAIA